MYSFANFFDHIFLENRGKKNVKKKKSTNIDSSPKPTLPARSSTPPTQRRSKQPSGAGISSSQHPGGELRAGDRRGCQAGRQEQRHGVSL
jgi:hypothetical protein